MNKISYIVLLAGALCTTPTLSAQDTKHKKTTTSQSKPTTAAAKSKSSADKKTLANDKKTAAPSTNQKTAKPAAEPSPEQQLERQRRKRMDEMLPATRALLFVDSLVVDKADFLQHLRLTPEIGNFVAPATLLPQGASVDSLGTTAFVNGLGHTAIYATADTTATHLCLAYRNAQGWTDPTPIEGLTGIERPDFPFLHIDGTTLYFAAQGPESIGGYDLFATRFNAETRQFVRPQNLGFPYNSPDNDYLLAIDEEAGIGALVTDRRQPDDKVCIYWFEDSEHRDVYDYDTTDKEAVAVVRDFAAISSIAATHEDREDELRAVRERWIQALAAVPAQRAPRQRYVIDDATVYTSLEQFRHSDARQLAQQWAAATELLAALEAEEDALRQGIAKQPDDTARQRLADLEAKLPLQRAEVSRLAKAYRAAELAK